MPVLMANHAATAANGQAITAGQSTATTASAASSSGRIVFRVVFPWATAGPTLGGGSGYGAAIQTPEVC